MKLTLRKANAVQAAINEAVKALDLNTRVELNEFEEVPDQIQSSRDRFWENNTKRDQLLDCLYEIRQLVAQANAASGINDMLAQIAHFEKQISYKNSLVNKGAQTALIVLNGQLQKNANAKDEGFGYRTIDVNTSILTEEEVTALRKELADARKQKQKLQDTLLELNVRTEIELSKTAADLLSKFDIV